jgi:transposase
VDDALWELIGPIVEDAPRRLGRPRHSPRACLEGILYVLYTDTPWCEVPYRELGLPSGETCRRRLEEWQQRGLVDVVFLQLRDRLARDGRLDLSRVIIDASLVEAKKGARRSRAHCVVTKAPATT